MKYTIDLFGGKEKVLSRIKEGLCSAVESASRKEIKFILEEIGLRGQNLKKIIEGTNFSTLELLGTFFDRELINYLGEPNLNNENLRDYWERQMKSSPMVIAGTKPRGGSKDSAMRFYLRTRAYGELAQTA